MGRVLWRVMRKEFIQTFRDRRMLAIVLIVPVLQTVIFGFAVNMDLTAQPLVVADLDRTPASRELVRAMANHDGFRLIGERASEEEATQAVLLGEAGLALLIPRGYAKDAEREGATLALVLDGSDSNTALRASQELGAILTARQSDRLLARASLQLAAKGVSPDRALPRLSMQIRSWFNPQMRSAVFTVPGVLGLVLLVITMMLTALGLTREKEIGTLEQIMVTPIKPWQLIMGKCLPFAILGMVDVGVIVLAMALVFNIPVLGSLPALGLACLLFLLVALGFGLFISTISATQQQAMLTAFFFIMPLILLSGFIYPVESMPEFGQWIAACNPVRYFIVLTRGIIVKGASLADLWDSAAILAGMAVAVLGGASLRFRKRLG